MTLHRSVSDKWKAGGRLAENFSNIKMSAELNNLPIFANAVRQEISRPVFALLEKGPLKESCTFISYEAVTELSLEKRLEYMNDKVLDEYQERAGD